MPFFRREPRASESVDSSSGGGVTQIARGTRLEGTLRGDAEVWIEGEVAGAIEISEIVTVGPDGSVRGPVQARIVRVGGRIEGDLRAERIEILAGARVVGDLFAPRIIVAEGAHFEGRASMTSRPSVPASLQTTTPSPATAEAPAAPTTAPTAPKTESLPESPSTTNQPPKRSAARERRGAKSSEGAGKL